MDKAEYETLENQMRDVNEELNDIISTCQELKSDMTDLISVNNELIDEDYIDSNIDKLNEQSSYISGTIIPNITSKE